MPSPTIESRRRRRVLLMSCDAAVANVAREALPPDWALIESIALEELGGFEQVLQLRFLLIDLDTGGAWDAIETIERIRGELMVNVPIFCFGGDAAARDAARMAGADRFLDQAALRTWLPEFCAQFGW